MLRQLLTDTRDDCAVVYHILLNCCKKKKGIYQELDFYDFKWIIDRANFTYAKKYNLPLISYGFVNWNSDVDLLPENFNYDWEMVYKISNTGRVTKDKKKMINRPYSDFISEAAVETLNKTILKWKIYGKVFVKLSKIFNKEA